MDSPAQRNGPPFPYSRVLDSDHRPLAAALVLIHPLGNVTAIPTQIFRRGYPWDDIEQLVVCFPETER